LVWSLGISELIAAPTQTAAKISQAFSFITSHELTQFKR
jgi:hypothetical protein